MTRISILRRGLATVAVAAAVVTASAGLSGAQAATTAATTMSTSSSATVTAGRTVTLTLSLRSAITGSVIPNVPVTLWSRPWATTTWSVAANTTTNSSGVASVVVKPMHNTQYVWVFAGNAQYQAQESGIVNIWVAPWIYITANHPSATTLNVWGSVTPDETGQAVVLQRLINGAWSNIGSAIIKSQVMPNGHTATGYSFHLSGLTLHSYYFRAFRAGTGSNAQGYSATLHVTF